MENQLFILRTKYAEIIEKFAYAEELTYYHNEYDNEITIYFDSLYQMSFKTQALIDANEQGYVIPWNKFDDEQENIELSKDLPMEEFKNWVSEERERQYMIYLNERK
jgi:hypothetical protein